MEEHSREKLGSAFEDLVLSRNEPCQSVRAGSIKASDTGWLNYLPDAHISFLSPVYFQSCVLEL